MANGAIENTPTNPNVMSSVTSDGFTVESNFETPAQLKASLGITDVPVEGDGEPVADEPRQAPTRPRRSRREDPRVAVESAIAKQREAERLAEERAARLEALEAENAELKKPRPAPVVAPAVPQPPTPPLPLPSAATATPPITEAAYKRYLAMPDAPKAEQFSDLNEWQYAVNVFVTDKRYAELRAQDRQMEAMQSQRTTLQSRVVAETEKDPTFPQRLRDIPIDKRVIPYLAQHKQAGDVMVYLVNHPEIAQELATLQPDLQSELPSAAQIERIGEIVGVIKAQSAAALSTTASARPAISQAKSPTKRVSGQPPAATDEPPGDDASEAEHDAYWGPRRASLRRRHR